MSTTEFVVVDCILLWITKQNYLLSYLMCFFFLSTMTEIIKLVNLKDKFAALPNLEKVLV